ncbi:Winged helix DNA-binding domain-containing protein [Mycena indigotica]|uniref:Winged helix DNA-binding domain-containing protein n=1 Tax=Mycena indigotica TaxID=2126181 RepID=A0A8H6T529_9AGAR|nr:Winged helix DNA-binding domain-containing protein [Mycena indigotica]KAF7311908.1 Winged helix DNA-binding domain-containing protein [Mycena indigotica]
MDMVKCTWATRQYLLQDTAVPILALALLRRHFHSLASGLHLSHLLQHPPLNLPPNVPVTLAALPDFPPDVPPNLSLSLLAQVAIYGSPRKQLTLHEIHRAIEQRYEYFRHAEKWKDSLRHVLSLRNPFRNIERPMQEPGKGGYWTLDFSEGEGNKRVRKRGKSTGPRKYDQESGEEGDTDVESGSEYEDHRPYGHLYVDTASRIQQEFSPTPSPSSSSSRSSGGIPSTVAPGPTIFRRATMSASHPYPPSFPSHPPTHLQHQQGPVRDSRMLRGHSSLPPAHEQGVPRGGQGDRPWSPGRA